MLNTLSNKFLVFTASLLMVAGALASEMYKWQDEDGIWHFSSVPPETEDKYDSITLPADPKPMVSMRKLGLDREPEYAFFNNTWGPIELEIKLNDAENVMSDPPLPASFVLQGQTEQRLVKIMALDPTEGFSYRLSYQHMIGPPLDRLPPEVDYYPPFPAGFQFPISQGFDNDETHSNPPNQYAVDIVMPVGTPILAARGGKVMEAEDRFRGGGKQERYLTRANTVRILHDDGTMAVYAHLQTSSIRVQRGARVKHGQWIADSGNTGYSSGPHLHFVVQLNGGMSLESLPFRFVAPAGSTMTPGERTMIDGVLPKE